MPCEVMWQGVRAKVSEAAGDVRDALQRESNQTQSILDRAKHSILDVYNPYDEIDRRASSAHNVTSTHSVHTTRQNWCQRLCCPAHRTERNVSMLSSTWIFLILLGLVTAITGVAVDTVDGLLLEIRYNMLSDFSWENYLLWIVWGLGFGVIALSTGQFITSLAEGSGLPQMKSVLAGTALNRYLTFRVLVAKVIGFGASIISGLSVGKEGPFVHVSCVLATLLWKIPIFSKIRHNHAMRQQMLAAAVAAGVTAVFGAPIGGVIFSVEVTSTYYMVSNLWRAFVCAVVAVLFFEGINAIQQGALFKRTEFEAQDTSWQIVAFVLLGIICGILAIVFIRAVSKLQVARRVLIKGLRSRYVVGLSAILSIVILTYSTSYLRLNDRRVINTLFLEEPAMDKNNTVIEDSRRLWEPLHHLQGKTLTSNDQDTVLKENSFNNSWWNSINPWSDRVLSPTVIHLDASDRGLELWDSPNLLVALFIYCIIKFLTTSVSISLPIPCGLFTPVFTLGAAVGRLLGEILARIFPDANIIPGAYAVVGAAGLSAAVTQTLSPALIVFELTRQIHHMVPVLVCVLVAYSVAGLFTVGIYDILMAINGLPYLPRAFSSHLYKLYGRDLMHSTKRQPHYLTLRSTFRDIMKLLNAAPLGGAHGQPLTEYPVVDSHDNMILVGSVKTTTLQRIFDRRHRAAKRSGKSLPDPVDTRSRARTIDASAYQHYDTVASIGTRTRWIRSVNEVFGHTAARSQTHKRGNLSKHDGHERTQYDSKGQTKTVKNNENSSHTEGLRPQFPQHPTAESHRSEDTMGSINSASHMLQHDSPTFDGHCHVYVGNRTDSPSSAISHTFTNEDESCDSPLSQSANAPAVNPIYNEQRIAKDNGRIVRFASSPTRTNSPGKDIDSQVAEVDSQVVDQPSNSTKPSTNSPNHSTTLTASTNSPNHSFTLTPSADSRNHSSTLRPSTNQSTNSMSDITSSNQSSLRLNRLWNQDHIGDVDMAWLDEQICFSGLHTELLYSLNLRMASDGRVFVQQNHSKHNLPGFSPMANNSGIWRQEYDSPTGSTPSLNGELQFQQSAATNILNTLDMDKNATPEDQDASDDDIHSISGTGPAHVMVPSSRSRTSASYTIHVDPAPFVVTELTPLTKIHFLFAIASFAQLFVTREGRLIGTILKQDLTDERRLVATEQISSPPIHFDRSVDIESITGLTIPPSQTLSRDDTSDRTNTA